MDSDLVYSSDCYLQKRGSMRKGFGGNYRRASDSFTVPRTKPSSSASGGSNDARLLDSSSSLKSSSFCHKNRTDEPDQPPSSSSSIFMTASTDNPQQSKNIRLSDIPRDTTAKAEKKRERNGENFVTGHGTGALPSTGCQVQGEGDGSEGSENRQIPLADRQGPPLLHLTEDESSCVSVKECIRSLERTGVTWSAMEEKSKHASKTRVAELRETILRRSSENLADDAGCSVPPRVNKRPVSAFLESSISSFPKIPISLIQRRSIGSLLKPSHTSLPQRPLSTILNPVFEPKSTAEKQESNPHEKQIDGSALNNPARKRSFKHFIGVGRKDVKGNVCSLQGKSNVESSNKTTNERDTSCDIRIPGADMVAGNLIKTDSSDSGIDTKTDCFGNKSGPGGVEGLPVGQFQTTTSLEKLSHSSRQHSTKTFPHIQGNDSLSPEHCSGLNEMGNIPLRSESAPKGDSVNFSASVIFVDLESEELAEISSEEVLFDELAARILSRLKDSESDLHAVLTPSEFYRTPFYYMLDVIQGIKIPEFWIKLPTVNIRAECETSDRSLDEDKMALLDSIKSKLEVIKKNRELIKEKIIKRKDFESQVSSVVKCRLEKKKYDKYCLYLSELDKVLHLMFMLASRLASTENALNCPRQGDNETISKLLTAKRASLIEKLEDAKLLKDGIDRRSEVVDSFLKANLSESEYAAYQDLVLAIIRLHFLHQWTEVRQLQCERQLKALNATLVNSGSTQC